MNETKKATFVFKKDTMKLLDDVAFLLNVKKVDLVNNALINHLETLIRENDLREKIIELRNLRK
jgi:hypothetical protein